jgi:hypothetical protein
MASTSSSGMIVVLRTKDSHDMHLNVFYPCGYARKELGINPTEARVVVCDGVVRQDQLIKEDGACTWFRVTRKVCLILLSPCLA